MRKILLGLAGMLLLLVLVALVFLWRLDVDQYRSEVQVALSTRLNRQVSIESLSLDYFPLRVAANGIRIAEDSDFGSEAFLSADGIKFAVALWPLLMDRDLQVAAVQIESPKVRLVQNRLGVWNVSSLWQHSGDSAVEEATPAPAGQRLTLTVQQFDLMQGQIELKRSGDQVRRYSELSLHARELGLDKAFPIELSAQLPDQGSVRLEGQLGPLNLDDPLRSALQASIVMENMSLAASGWAGDGDQVSGNVGLQLSLTAQNGSLHSKGEIEARGLRLLGAARASEQRIVLAQETDYDLIRRRGRLEQGVLRTGDAAIALSGDLSQEKDAMRLNMALTGTALSVDELQALIPAFGIQLPEQSRLSGGELDLDLSVVGPLNALTIAGPIALRGARLDGFSLGGRMSALSALAGLPAPKDTLIEQGSVMFSRGPQGMQFDSIEVHVAELGEVTGAGSVDLDQRIKMKLRVKVDADVAERAGGGATSGTGLGRFTSGAMRYASTRGLDVRVGGSLGAPEVKVSDSALAGTVLSGLLAPDDEQSGDEGAERPSDRERVGAALLQLLNKKKGSDQDDDSDD